MRKGWEIKKMKEICKLINGRAYSKNELLKNGKYRVLRVGNFFTNQDWYFSDLELPNEKYCENGDLLYAWSASFGPRIWTEEKVIYHYHIWKVIPNENYVTKDFLFKLLEWDIDKIKKDHGTGTTMMHVGKGSMDERDVPLPPLHEQQRIVAILEKAFAAIDKAKANTEKNLQNAKELFESYLQNIFSHPGKDWEEKRLGEVCNYEKIPNNRNNLPYVGLEHIESNSGKFLGTKNPTSVKSLTFFFTKSNILYGRLRPYLNKVLLPDFDGHCSTEIFPIKVHLKLDKRFLYYWLTNSSTVKMINATWTGARMPRANMNAVLEFSFMLPTLKEQILIVNKLDSLKIETQKLETLYRQKLEDLEELKKSILQKAFKGQLDYDSYDLSDLSD